MYVLAFGLAFFATPATAKSVGVWDVPPRASFKIAGDGVPAVIEMYRVWFQNVTVKQNACADGKTTPCDYGPYRTPPCRYTMCPADGTQSSLGYGRSQQITSSTGRTGDYEYLRPHRPTTTQWSKSQSTGGPPSYHRVVSSSGHELSYEDDVTKTRQCMHHGQSSCSCPDDSHGDYERE